MWIDLQRKEHIKYLYIWLGINESSITSEALFIYFTIKIEISLNIYILVHYIYNLASWIYNVIMLKFIANDRNKMFTVL